MQKILISICSIIVVCAAHADTETIKWYVDGNIYDTTTCESGSDIILPTPPTPPYGYTFTGWTPVYDLSTLNTSIQGEAYYAIVDKGFCRYINSDVSNVSTTSCTDSNFSDLTAGLWKTEFSYGTVYGESKCSATSGTYAVSGNPVDTPGQYCWCRATGFIPNNENLMYEPTVSVWVYYYNASVASMCANNCSSACGEYIRTDPSFRSAIYGSNL